MTFGGVDMGDIRIFFCKDGQGHPGTWIAINVDDVDAYHQQISSRGARIIAKPQSFDWGLREMLVEDPDGHRIRFGHGISLRGKSEPTMPGNIRILPGLPSLDELERLIKAVGWPQPSGHRLTMGDSSNIAYSVIARNQDNEEIVGCAFLYSDSAGFYYIKNVIVHPDWQGRLIGTRLVKLIDEWFTENAPDHSTVALHTGSHLASFYRQFGFSTSFSMQKTIVRNQ